MRFFFIIPSPLSVLLFFLANRASQRLSSLIFLLWACFLFFLFLSLCEPFLLFLRSTRLTFCFNLATLPCERTKMTALDSSGNDSKINAVIVSKRKRVVVLMSLRNWVPYVAVNFELLTPITRTNCPALNFVVLVMISPECASIKNIDFPG